MRARLSPAPWTPTKSRRDTPWWRAASTRCAPARAEEVGRAGVARPRVARGGAAMTERADDDVVAGDGGVDGGGVEHVAGDDARAGRGGRRIAHERGDLVAGGERLRDDGRPVPPEAPNTTSFAMGVRCRNMRIGVISDTHGLMRPEAVAALAGSELIVHAGDIGAPEVLEALAAIAPVSAVRGNNDKGAWAPALPADRGRRRRRRASSTSSTTSASSTSIRRRRVRRGDRRPLASAAQRGRRRRALFQPGHRRPAPLHAADHRRAHRRRPQRCRHDPLLA